MRAAFVGTMTLVLLIGSSTLQAQTMKLGEVLVFHAPDLRPDADADAFEAHALDNVVPAWKKRVAGGDVALVRKDRGPRPGRYLLVSAFARSARARVGDVTADMGRFATGRGQTVEYHLVAPEKAGALPDVDILGIHYTKVQPERLDAFDRFIADTLHPAVGNLRPDLRLLYYKPVSGTDAGNYITVFALTRESRDKYWPKGADSEVLKSAFKPVQPLADQLKAYLVEGSYATGNLAAAVYESREWVDWVVVSAPKPWKTLFNGRDLTGFTTTGTAEWKLENGVISGGQFGDPTKRGSLVTVDEFQDFELELEFLIDEHGKYNSGVAIRGGGGYQINIGRPAAEEFIGVGARRGPTRTWAWLHKGDEQDTIRKKLEWNTIRVLAKGSHFEITLNAVKTADVTDPEPDPNWLRRGTLAFQTYGAEGHAGFIKFRNIRIREL